jgi:hypothetical protein
MTLRGQGEISQDVIATFPHEVFEIDNAYYELEGDIFSCIVTVGWWSFISQLALQSQLFLLARATFSVAPPRKTRRTEQNGFTLDNIFHSFKLHIFIMRTGVCHAESNHVLPC